jgi:hypothetical protein
MASRRPSPGQRLNSVFTDAKSCVKRPTTTMKTIDTAASVTRWPISSLPALASTVLITATRTPTAASLKIRSMFRPGPPSVSEQQESERHACRDSERPPQALALAAIVGGALTLHTDARDGVLEMPLVLLPAELAERIA